MKHKSFNRTLAALLSVMLIVGLLPTTVFAANNVTVTVNGQELEDGVPVQCGEGTVKFDAANNTLTLDNATISESSTESVLIIRGNSNSLTVNLIGNNQISSTSENYFPIYIDNGDVTIKGTNADTLTLESNSDSLSGSFCNLTIDGCILDVTSHNWGGITTGNGEISIKNNAKVTVDSQAIAIWGDNGIQISDSSVYATTKGEEQNTLTSYGVISISNSTVEATGTSSTAFPSIYAAGDINVSSNSNVEATSSGMRGIFTDSDMMVTDSTVTATGTTAEGMVVVGALSLTNSKLTASSKPNDYIPAIVTKNFSITNSEVTANGGFDLLDWNEGNTDGISLSITPANGKLAEFKVDGDNWDGSAAAHFKEGSESPYDTAVNFSANEMNWLGAYRYIHIGEHIHTGGTATCELSAVCEDCGRAYGNALGHSAVKTEAKEATCTEDGNSEYWYCDMCGKYFSDETLTKEIKKEETVVKATGHDIELKNAKETTCTAEGYTGDKVCKICGEVIEKGKAILKLAHSYQDGKCTVCGAADPNYKPTEPETPDKGDTESPQTGDNSHMALWIALLFVSGAGLFGATVYNKKRKYNR